MAMADSHAQQMGAPLHPPPPAQHQHQHQHQQQPPHPQPQQPQNTTDLKRKRSQSHDAIHPAAAPLPKAAKTHNHLQINYLARQCETDLPLITGDDTIPNILSLLNDYQGVLDRHESMACNLGARPLGPMLVKRFERLFDAPPRVLKTHGKDGTTVTWLDVVEFARNKPEQFQLGQMSEGLRVCQFYTKQCRVQISEEDFQLISSGIPQKMIPPQPIVEDEEKELGTLEILEKNLVQVANLADQVAARTRQLNHRLKGRRQAILDRRATASPAPPMRPASPSNVALMNGASSQVAGPGVPNMALSSQSSPGGFVAINARQHGDRDQNGNGASPVTRQDLLTKFHTLHDRRSSSQSTNPPSDSRRLSTGQPPPATPTPHAQVVKTTSKSMEPVGPASVPRGPGPYPETELQHMLNSPVPIPNTPSTLLSAASQRASQPAEKDDGGPFKAEMVHRMEGLAKGERILPPCDRCRRLHMDCLKNLTACMGCTKKHAKCSWREVRESELPGRPTIFVAERVGGGLEGEHGPEVQERASTGSPGVGAGVSPSQYRMASPSHMHGPGSGISQQQQQQQPSYPPPDVRSIAHLPSPPRATTTTTSTSSSVAAEADTRDRERDRDRDTRDRLQEAARLSLAQQAVHAQQQQGQGPGPGTGTGAGHGAGHAPGHGDGAQAQTQFQAMVA